jgi:hypothetical protein
MHRGFASCAFGCWSLAATLTGCSGDTALSPLGRAGLENTTLVVRSNTSPAAPVDRRRAWMAPGAKGMNLLYVSDIDASNDVYVYSYPKGTLVGQLTGFNEPQGECADRAGDVFVTNTNDANILEYGHGGTTPIATLADPGEYPVGCSVDSVTGDLAVTNKFGYGTTEGSLEIYKKAKGTPTRFEDPDVFFMYFCGYDDQGNLFIDGAPVSGDFAFAELPKGKRLFTNITLNQTFEFPGGVQWDGKHIAVGNQAGYYEQANVIFQFTISGSSGTAVGATQLDGSCDVVQFWIVGKRVIGPDYCDNDVGFWKYPAGGNKIKVILGNGRSQGGPIGSVVSAAKSSS